MCDWERSVEEKYLNRDFYNWDIISRRANREKENTSFSLLALREKLYTNQLNQ